MDDSFAIPPRLSRNCDSLYENLFLSSERMNKDNKIDSRVKQVKPVPAARHTFLNPVTGTYENFTFPSVKSEERRPSTYENFLLPQQSCSPVCEPFKESASAFPESFSENAYKNTRSLLDEFDPLFEKCQISDSALNQSETIDWNKNVADISGSIPSTECKGVSQFPEFDAISAVESLFEDGSFFSWDNNGNSPVSTLSDASSMVDPSLVFSDYSPEIREKKPKSLPGISPAIKRVSTFKRSFLQTDFLGSLKQVGIQKPADYVEDITSSEQNHSGWLSIGRSKEKKSVMAVKLTATPVNLLFEDQSGVVKDEIHTRKVISVKLVGMTTIELVVCSGKRKVVYLFLSAEAVASSWFQILCSDCLNLTEQLLEGIWCTAKVYLKESITAKFNTGIVILGKKELRYRPQSNLKFEVIDLRKVKKISLSDEKSEDSCRVAYENGPVLLISLQGNLSLYLQMDLASETLNLERVLRQTIVPSSPKLEDQLLTKDDVPVIVDAFIRHITLHGNSAEGIYRKAGTQSRINKLTEFFQNDSSCLISREEYTEHDVASALKRFFRKLPEPLLTSELFPEFVAATAIEDEELRLGVYLQLVSHLPVVHAATLKQLLGHLYSIDQHSAKNLMPASNLATLWGPTLLATEANPDNLRYSSAQCDSSLMYDLIIHYPELYGIDQVQLEKEEKIQHVSERILQGFVPKKNAGDIRVWVHVEVGGDQLERSALVVQSRTESSEPVSATITPSTRVSDLIEHIQQQHRINYNGPCMLIESVLGGRLLRPLHPEMLILPTVIRWPDWDVDDRKDNRLILRTDGYLRRLCAWFNKPPELETVQFADRKSKNYKFLPVSCRDGKLQVFKDQKKNVILHELSLDSVQCYIGSETKRKSVGPHSVTIVSTSESLKRTKETPFCGYTFSVYSEDELIRWYILLLTNGYLDPIAKPTQTRIMSVC